MQLKGKKILVTGADGFIGSHMVECLHKNGAKVRALSLYNSFNTWGWLEDVHCLDKIEVFTGDIRDAHDCLNMTERVDVIVHLAALIAIPYSYQNPESYIKTNVEGTLNICQAAVKNKVSLLMHVSTSEVYGSALYVPIDEKHPIQPQSPYSASKVGADAIVESFRRSFNLSAVTARPFNTFGPRQSARAVIPSIIIQLASGIRKIRLGSLNTIRDFNYVADTCNAVSALLSCEAAKGCTVNIGSGKEATIKEVFQMICAEMRISNAEIVTDKKRIRPDKSEVMRLCCDNSRLAGMTGFKPAFSLKSGLKKTINWFNNPVNLQKYKAEIYNV